jgi:hypothetical protein
MEIHLLLVHLKVIMEDQQGFLVHQEMKEQVAVERLL